MTGLTTVGAKFIKNSQMEQRRLIVTGTHYNPDLIGAVNWFLAIISAIIPGEKLMTGAIKADA